MRREEEGNTIMLWRRSVPKDRRRGRQALLHLGNERLTLGTSASWGAKASAPPRSMKVPRALTRFSSTPTSADVRSSYLAIAFTCPALITVAATHQGSPAREHSDT